MITAFRGSHFTLVSILQHEINQGDQTMEAREGILIWGDVLPDIVEEALDAGGTLQEEEFKHLASCLGQADWSYIFMSSWWIHLGEGKNFL